MKLFILLFIAISAGFSVNKANADYPSYFFNKKKIKISYKNFHTYIIPQSSAIVKEYYHILKKLNPLHLELINLKEKVDSLKHHYNQRTVDCYKTERLCYKEIFKLYKLTREIDILLLKTKNKYSYLKNKNMNNQLDSVLLVSTKLNTISHSNYELMHMFEEQLLTIDTRFEIHSTAKKKLNELILLINSNTHILITAFVPQKFKKEFDFVWEQFIKKLELYILKRKDKKYLLNSLGDLNMTWNSFHMKISKGNLRFPKKLLKIISIQHNRWNSILKVLLRRRWRR